MYIRVDRESSLFRLLTDFLSAYERRTDVMEASTDVAIQKKIDEITANLKTSTDSLQESIEADKGE